MAAWCPTTPFEEEIVSFQPQYNFIYGHLNDEELQRREFQPRPRQHLEFLEYKTKNNKKCKDNSNAFEMPSIDGDSLSLIRTVHEMAGTKNMGLDAHADDWETLDNVERETVAMMRHCGLEPSLDGPLDPELTLPTLPVEERPFVRRNGKILYPLLLDVDHFRCDSTRVRNAEAVKAILAESSANKPFKSEENEIKPLLTDFDEFESLEKCEQREAKKFLAQFPKLGNNSGKEQKQKSNQIKSPQKNKSVKAKAVVDVKPTDNWRIRNDSNTQNVSSSANMWKNWRSPSTSLNKSFSSAHSTSFESCNSSYFSLNDSFSDSFNSAKETLDSSHDGNKQQSYAAAIEGNSKTGTVKKQNSTKKVDKKMLTPKAVYELKMKTQRRMQ